jgi:hypothetical protein
MKPSVTIKVTPKVVCLLRFVAAMRREKQYHILERLLQAEVDQMLKGETKAAAIPEGWERLSPRRKRSAAKS